MDILAEEDNLLAEMAASAYSQCVAVSEVSVNKERRPQLIINREQILATPSGNPEKSHGKKLLADGNSPDL